MSGWAQSSSVLLFSWSPPPLLDINGNISHYTVRVTEVDSGRVWMFLAIELHITVASLKPYHEYSCTVSASTVGNGPFSKAITVRTAQGGKSKLCKGPQKNDHSASYQQKFIKQI